MKPILAVTTRASASLVCDLHTTDVIFPENWPYPIQRKECASIDEIKEFVKDSGAELVYFGMRATGIPNRPIKVTDVEKLEKAFKAYERVLNRAEKMGWR